MKNKFSRLSRVLTVFFMCVVILSTTAVLGYFSYAFLEIKGENANAAPWTEEAEFNAENYLSYISDDTFTLLCVSDLNLSFKDAFTNISFEKISALTEGTSPDIMLLNGNLTRSNFSASLIKKLKNKISLPWLFTFGENDEIGPFDKARRIDTANKKSECVMTKGNSATGIGSNLILIKNSSGEYIQSIFLFDADKEKRPAQAQWFNWAVYNLNLTGNVPAIIFINDKITENSALYSALDKTHLSHIFSGGSAEYDYVQTPENVYLYSTIPFCGSEAGGTKIRITETSVAVDFFKFD